MSASHPIHPALAPLAAAALEMPFEDCVDVLRAAVKAPAWLRPEHRIGDPNGYLRHVLYVDPRQRFVITAIAWLPGQVSPVHGHQVWCAYGVVEGELTEEQFRESYGKLTPLGSKVYGPGEAADRDLDCKAVHRVSNRSRDVVVTLHLYGVSAERLTTGINRVFA